MPESPRSVRVLLTASEAYPALEIAFLAASSEIWVSFPVFELTTHLHSRAAMAIGRTWFDLVVHTLNRGVALNLVISDADPIVCAATHRAATRQLRHFSAAAAVANPGTRLKALLCRHPAETGALARLAIWPSMMRQVFRLSGWLNRLTPDRRAAALRDMDAAALNLTLRPDGTVAPRLWSLPRRYRVVHHQKLAVIDRRILFIGGVDLAKGQLDGATHRPSGGHGRNAVQLMIEGPVVAEAQQHLQSFRDVIAGLEPPAKTRRLMRTLSRPNRLRLWNVDPDPLVGELRTAHVVLARRARNLIYLETAFFQDVGLANEIAETARRTPGLNMILILPAVPGDPGAGGKRDLDARFGAALQAHVLRILCKALGSRLFVGSAARTPSIAHGGTGGQPPPLHLAPPPCDRQTRVSVFDDAAAIVSSADLNARSLRHNTEAGVYLTTENDVIDLRHRVMAHWLPQDIGLDAFGAATAVRLWSHVAWRNAAEPPAEGQGYLLPHAYAAAAALGRKLPQAPRDFA